MAGRRSARLDYNGFVECIRCLAERRHDSFAGLVELLVSRYLGIDNQGSSMELRWHMARAVIGEGTAATRASVVGCPMAYDEDSNLMTPWRYARVMEGLRVSGRICATIGSPLHRGHYWMCRSCPTLLAFLPLETLAGRTILSFS